MVFANMIETVIKFNEFEISPEIKDLFLYRLDMDESYRTVPIPLTSLTDTGTKNFIITSLNQLVITESLHMATAMTDNDLYVVRKFCYLKRDFIAVAILNKRQRYFLRIVNKLIKGRAVRDKIKTCLRVQAIINKTIIHK